MKVNYIYHHSITRGSSTILKLTYASNVVIVDVYLMNVRNGKIGRVYV